MNIKRTISVLAILLITACTTSTTINNTGSVPSSIHEPLPTISSTVTPAITPTLTPTVTITPTRQLPIGEVVYHPADDSIAYDWYSYIPTTVDFSKENNIWVSGIHANDFSNSYSRMSEISHENAIALSQYCVKYKFILIVPVIPRLEGQQYTIFYDAVLPPIVFQSSTDPFYQRPDLKVVQMIDQYLQDLRGDGYLMSDKVNMDGFSAGGAFTQRFALLHPERINALAAGHAFGSLVMPVSTYQGGVLDWPIGTSDFETLTGQEFNNEEYIQIPQFIFIGANDHDTATLKDMEIGYIPIYQSLNQAYFLNDVFGQGGVVRVENQVKYLNSLGYDNIFFKSYPGMGHEYPTSVLEDALYFLVHKALPPEEPTAANETENPADSDAKPENGVIPVKEISPIDGMTIVFVSEGIFLMGSSISENPNEYPQHKVYLDSFWIDQTEVTNAMYRQCMDEGVCTLSHRWDFIEYQNYYSDPKFNTYPILSVTWYEAETYCEWAGRRLPTEAEWEKAARGTDGRKFPWGDKITTGTLLNFADKRFNQPWSDMTIDDGYSDVAPVGSYPDGVSIYGALDMSGNVAEWVNDWYDYFPDESRSVILENPIGPLTGTEKIYKGGTAGESIFGGIRLSSRSHANPEDYEWGTGIRCAITNP